MIPHMSTESTAPEIAILSEMTAIRVRDVWLPGGMSIECLEKLADLFNDKACPDCDYSCDEMAIRAYKVVQSSMM